MSWKSRIQILDLDMGERIEVTCKSCGYTWYEFVSDYLGRPYLRQLYLDEFETRLKCQQWACKGKIRIALSSEAETEGWSDAWCKVGL